VIPNDRKFQELLLYVASRCEGDPTFGAVKLNKILFFADFLAYGKLGKAITGQAYQKLEHGPAPVRLIPLKRELVPQAAVEQQRDYYGHVQTRLIALREADLSEFTGAEVAIIDAVIRDLWDQNATEVSDLSHKFLGWEVADVQEVIPYETVFLDSRPLTAKEEERAAELGVERRRS